MRANYQTAVLLVMEAFILQGEAFASDYGTTGLIDIPTARFEVDSTLAVGASTDERHRQFTITYQATPWLQGTFRYTGFNDFLLWDRNYEVKARILEEDRVLPQVALGIRDLVGTGDFGSEYLVASKKFKSTDISLGIGWGRLAGDGIFSNPLIELDSRFTSRSADTGVGGDFSFGDFFSGEDVGLFGGVQHRFSSLPLTGMVEYNPDRYDKNFSRGVPRPRDPWSYGITWHAAPGLDLRLSVQHGRELGIGFTSKFRSSTELPRPAGHEFISSYYLPQSGLPAQINKSSWYDRLLYDAERSGLLLVEGSISPDGNSAKLVVGNTSYNIWNDAISRHIALADLHLPALVKSIYFVIEENGHRPITLVVPRPSSTFGLADSQLVEQTRLLSGRSLEMPQHRTGFATGTINTSINVRSKFQLFDPDDPARYQLFLDIASEFILNNHWAVRTSVAVDLENNFDESKRQESNSALPNVRSNVARYLADGDTGLEKFIIEGRDTYGRALHYRAFGGYLETMYAGLGGEVLYWPHRSRLAVGMSLAFVKQRDYARKLGFLDYSVITSHLSIYWATPFYNYDAAVHVGRYLAKDHGATLEMRRTFRNGWQIGVWATFTNVPFEKFGEGSFDKGLFFQIPLDALFGGVSKPICD